MMMMKRLSGTVLAAALTTFASAGGAWAADPPATADVLAKLHHANQEEIAMGKLAQKNGTSKDVKSFGKTLVKDHTAADKKVVALAKQEKVTLPTETPATSSMADMKGADFDAKFAREMVDGHKTVLADATAARDNTNDEKLKKLLTDMVPTLQKHEDEAQKLVDSSHNNKK